MLQIVSPIVHCLDNGLDEDTVLCLVQLFIVMWGSSGGMSLGVILRALDGLSLDLSEGWLSRRIIQWSCHRRGTV